MKILITGGTHGMGKGVAKVLASIDNQQHQLIILCRSPKLGEEVMEEFKNTTLINDISLIICDLAKLSDLKSAIKEIQRKHTFLDGIFIDAGLGYAAERVETEDGVDAHFQVNYLSQFMLTLNLLHLLENSASGGRVIFNVTEGGKIFWDDMQMINNWGYENGIHQAMATLMKFFGKFITIEECGEIMAPLFTESQQESLKKSGKFLTLTNNRFTELIEEKEILDSKLQDRLWEISLELCADKKTKEISKTL